VTRGSGSDLDPSRQAVDLLLVPDAGEREVRAVGAVGAQQEEDGPIDEEETYLHEHLLGR
jgi:hypothetical protein